MSLYLMYGKYQTGTMEDISSERTEKAKQVIKENGGTLKAGYAVLGRSDLLFIVDFPDIADVVKTSLTMKDMFGIRFSTNGAMTIEEFDKLF